MKIPSFKNNFFIIFTVQRGTDWVSFRQTHKMFEIFAGKVQSFKERFFLVRPRSEPALNTLLKAEKEGVQDPRTLFPLCWTQDHFIYESKDFFRTITSLMKEETDACQKLSAFVQSFSRKVKTDKRGNPLMNADGTPVTNPRFINTHELLVSKYPEDCLGSSYFLFFHLACSCVLSFVSDLFLPFICVCRKNERFAGICE